MLQVYFLNFMMEEGYRRMTSLEWEMSCKIYTNHGIAGDEEIGRIIRWSEAEEIDGLICNWMDYDKVMFHKPMIPIYPITYTAFDTSIILHQLKKDLKAKNLEHLRKVVLGTNLPIHVRIDILEEMFDFELYNPNWSDELPQRFFDDLRQEGYEVVVCREEYFMKVRKSGMYPFYDPNGFEYIDFAQDIRNGVRQVAAGTQLKNALLDMTNMLNYSFEAICMLDQKGCLTAYNDQAKKMFEKPDLENYAGIHFSELVPAIGREDLYTLLNQGKSYYCRIIEANKQFGMLNITPNLKNGKVNGAIIHFTTVQQINEMESTVKQELYVKGHFAKYKLPDILGESDAIRKVKRQAERFAKYDSTVLLYGETGCGKEMFAQGIHNSSMRRAQPFVAVNCASLPSNLLESELFGYVDGAFTGALKKGKKGLFEIAHKGTIFLDEISEMDLQGQSRLLRVLQEKEIMRIGDDKVILVNVRVIAATNKDLEKLVEEGKFREDLYYRLNVLTLIIPPLGSRGRDVALIAESIIEELGKKYHKHIVLTDDAKDLLCACRWKGNVRQLRNFCERLAIVSDEKYISAEVLREEIDDFRLTVYEPKQKSGEKTEKYPKATSNVNNLADQLEKQQILDALAETNGNREQTAKILGISKATLWRKMKKYSINDA